MNSKESALYSKCRRAQKMIIDYLYRKINFSKDDQVLDVGCGSGDFTFEIGKNVTSVVGIDVSKDMIEYAQQHNQAGNVQYIVCDAQDFGSNLQVWKENQFDKVVTMNVLHWVKDRKSAIENMYSCLKPGGELFVVVSGQINKISGNNPDELPFYLQNHPKWNTFLQNYERRIYTDLSMCDWSQLLETEGFSLCYKEEKYPAEDFSTISSDFELKGYIQTLLEQFNYIPEIKHSEFMEDAVKWCQNELPRNDEGVMYCPSELYFIKAIKTTLNH